MAEQGLAGARAETYLQLTFPADQVHFVNSGAELARQVPARCAVPAFLLTKFLYVSLRAL